MAVTDQSLTRDALVLDLMRNISAAEGQFLGKADRDYTLGLLRDILEVFDGERVRPKAPVDPAAATVAGKRLARRLA